MRILILTQYFWPERFKINDLALALKERGHVVTIFTGKPNYPTGIFSEGYTFFNRSVEYWNGIKVYRSPIIPRGKGKGIHLFANYISFAIFAPIRMLFIRDKFDKIFVYEPSPVTIGIPGIIAKYKFKAPMYFWVQDLWPESISAAGDIKNKSIIYILDMLTRCIYKHSKKVLVQSKAFIPYILNQNIEETKLIYYPNSTESYYNEFSVEEGLLEKLPKGIKLMFAGNIGEAQSFDTLLLAASKLKKDLIDVNWIILGDGRMKEYVSLKIKELKLDNNFLLLGGFPSTEMPKYFSCADALIVSLKIDPIFALTIPSKIQSYLACGKPIIASLDGEASKIIEEANVGFTSPAEDYLGLVDNIKRFLSLNKDEQKVLGQNGRAYFNSEFEREILVDKLVQILDYE